MIFFSVFYQVHGLQLITRPNRSIAAFTGSNQTFIWNLSLTDNEKPKELKIQFGLWDKEKDHVKGNYLIWLVREPSGNESVNKGKGSESITKRLHWVGDLARGYFVAFQFSNVQRQDSGDYGIRFRVDGFPPDILQDSFTLIVQVRNGSSKVTEANYKDRLHSHALAKYFRSMLKYVQPRIRNLMLRRKFLLISFYRCIRDEGS